jgi:uncharacterized Tic20 family protein/vacuolar-type H+-ATPase subunit H
MSDQDTPPPMDPNPEEDNPVDDAVNDAGEAVDKAVDSADDDPGEAVDKAVDSADDDPGEAVDKAVDSADEAVESAAEKTAEAVDSAVESVKEAAAAPSTGGIGLGQGKLGESDERTMGMLAHILGGVTCIVGPLIIWMIKKDESPFVDDQGKEATNFQITILISHVVSMILGALTGGCASIILSPCIWLFSIILAILGGVDANKGKAYRYPFALRLIS